MKIYFTDQAHQFSKHLQLLKEEPIIPYDVFKLREQTSSIVIDTVKDLQIIDTSVLFDYRIFPPNIMTALCEWHYERRPMQVGDTIVQQVYIPPTRFSQKIIFGVRIKEVISEPSRIGFSYETLKGHVEKGISTFTVERTEAGVIACRIHTFSHPASFLTQLLGPVFSLPYQAYCTKHALENVRNQLEAHQYN